MDHKWGRNITLYGVSQPGVTLTARVPGAIGIVVLTNYLTSGGDAIYTRVPADTRPDDPYTYEAVARQAEHFPYGLPVEPDGPV